MVKCTVDFYCFELMRKIGQEVALGDLFGIAFAYPMIIIEA